MRTTIGVMFGGKSGEHEVSLVSGTTVMEFLDKSRYRVFALGIRKDGSPATAAESRRMLHHPLPEVDTVDLVIRPAASGRFIELRGRLADGAEICFDAVFPVLHGTYGEDGTIQGLLDMCEIPYVGCGVLGSAAGMDKVAMKALFRDAGLPVVPCRVLTREDSPEKLAAVQADILSKLGLPCFVKPARLGSSVGISKAKSAAELEAAIALAFRFDYKVLVEQGINAREIECSVIGHFQGRASQPGEIVPSREFYDYTAKYIDDQSTLLLPAALDPATTERIRELAARAFEAVGGEGFARVDFLLDRDNGALYGHEVNTIPGFTEISMFPKLWGISGLPLPQLLDELIRLALQRHSWRQALCTSYQAENVAR